MFGTFAALLIADSAIQWFAVGVGISVCTYACVKNGKGGKR